MTKNRKMCGKITKIARKVKDILVEITKLIIENSLLSVILGHFIATLLEKEIYLFSQKPMICSAYSFVALMIFGILKILWQLFFENNNKENACKTEEEK